MSILTNAQKLHFLDADTVYNKKRFTGLCIANTAGFAVGMYGLNQLWYAGQPRTAFHFFNDNAQWNQVDKVGHFYTAYMLTRATSDALLWCGTKEKKAYYASAIMGTTLMLTIEFFDGFSPTYGASFGDIAANTLGAVFYSGQQILWNENRIKPKFSYRNSPYAQYRPNLLGSNLQERMLKDYNGQTYWFAINPSSFLKETSLPKWLCLSVGYGANGMVSGREVSNNEMGFVSYRQYYLSLDVDFSKFKTQKRGLKQLFYILDMVHVPFPGFEITSKGEIKAHAFTF